MNPLLQAALASIVRAALMMGAGWLVQHGVWTNANAETYVTAAAMALVAYAWSIWTHYRSRVRLLTALQLPEGATEAHVHQRIAEGKGERV